MLVSRATRSFRLLTSLPLRLMFLGRGQVNFRWKDAAQRDGFHDSGLRMGFIAQEIKRVFPEFVHGYVSGLDFIIREPLGWGLTVV